jgi:predicted permease
MHALWQDVKYGLRLLRRSPGFTIVAVLTLALGIGANTAIFSLLHQVLLRRLPVKYPEELVLLHGPGIIHGHAWSDGDVGFSFSYPMYRGLRDRNTVLSGLMARYSFAASVAASGGTERGGAELVTGNYFDVLGVRPALGRLFNQEDDRVPGANPVVVLSHGYWLRRFGGERSVLNQTILVNNTPMTVVGVSQPGFTGIQAGETPDIFVPFMMKEQMLPNWATREGGKGFEDWNDYYLALLGRLRPGVSREKAEAELNVVYGPLLAEQLPTITGWDKDQKERFLKKKLDLMSGAKGRLTLQNDSRDPLTALAALAGLVLLLTCANVANLTLSRGAAREREIAIRAALGSSRWRMMRHLLVESALCATAGGILGLVVASWTLSILIPTVASGAQIMGLTAQLDGTLLLFAFGATAIAGIAFGLVPAWRLSRTSVSGSLKEQGGNASTGIAHMRFRKILVGMQVAFTTLLLAGAAIYAQTLWNLRRVNLGFPAENLLSFSVQPELNGYSTERAVALFDQLREHMSAVPGVRSVGACDTPMLTGDNNSRNITVRNMEAIPSDQQNVNYLSVSPHYFSTLGIPLVRGREFMAGDSMAAGKVGVISESAARRFFPNRSPIGERFAFGGGKVTPDIEIVGVVKDVQQIQVRTTGKPFERPYVYTPYAQTKGLGGMTFYLRTGQEPTTLGAAVREEVEKLDAALPVYNVKTMERVVDDNLLGERLVAGLSVSFGILAALLAALGIYGVLAYTVAQRTREIGVRMALGAEPRHVRLLVLREIGLLLALGAAAGLPAAYGLARASESLLFGVRPSSFLVYVADLGLIALVAFAACYLPTRRATRVAPINALRYE